MLAQPDGPLLARYPIHATLAAHDLDRARAWYADKLGVTPEVDDPSGLWFRFGEVTWLLIYRTEMAGTARNTQAGWSVRDIVGVMAELRSRGVEFEHVDFGNGMATVDGLMTVGPYRACWFKDSEGNTLEVSQVDHPD
jgi:catechol 2,3-dioxygenase-like lactoylglutathione lyase family enzyme